jgi:hypothetical protein
MRIMTIHCTGCDLTATTTTLSRPFVYCEDDVQLNVPRQYGWCVDCDSIVPMEALHEIPQTIADSLAQLAEALDKLSAKPVWYRFFYSREVLSSLSIKAKEIALLQKLITHREKDEKCLTCGSGQCESIDGLNNRADMPSIDQPWPTRSLHPGCGGEFMLLPCFTHFSFRFDTRYYNIDGQLTKIEKG